MPGKVLPTSDLAFKKILASEDHKTVTQGFIKDFFDVHVEVDDIRIVNPYSIHAYQEAAENGTYQVLRETLRDTTFDLSLADMTVEMQLTNQDVFLYRGFLYMGDLFRQGYDKLGHQRAGDRYGGLRPVWKMDLLRQPFFDDDLPFRLLLPHDPVRHVTLKPEVFRWGLFEMTKPGAPPELARWRDFLLSGKAGDDDPEYLHEAASIIDNVNMTREEREMISIQEKAEADYQTDLYYAEKKGRDEGIEQGIEQGMQRGTLGAKLDAARAALRRGFGREDIVAITGLDAATVDGLADELALSSV